MIDIRLPALSPTMSEGTLLRWRKAVGDSVSMGDVLAEIETDKITVDYESVESGVLVSQLVDEGAVVQVQEVIARLEPVAADSSRTASPARTMASPVARRLAREHTVDLTGVRGSGPNGRIIKADILGAQKQTDTKPPRRKLAEGADLSSMRKVIAARMQSAKQTIPHFYLTDDIRVDDLLALRVEFNSREGARVSLNHLVLKAAALASAEVVEMNVAYIDDRLVAYDAVDIGMAIATPRGLVAPVLRGVAKRTIREIAGDAHLLMTRATDGKLNLDDLQGGGITISNLGAHRVRAFTAIINPPQVAILAVGVAHPQPIVDDGRLVAATVMSVTLSADHRVIDGVVAARWMDHFKGNLEHPIRLLLS